MSKYLLKDTQLDFSSFCIIIINVKDKKKFLWCVSLSFLVFSCAGISKGGKNEAEANDFIQGFRWDNYDFVKRMEFVPAPMPSFAYDEKPGQLSTDALARSLRESERQALSASFVEAYYAGQLAGTPLLGVLGGDLIHGWPSDSPIAWVQNWRSSTKKANVWGLPSLVLAIRGLTQDKVFFVQGDILNMYGMGLGRGGANGAAGFGAPCGDEFVHKGKVAQYFDFGLLSFNDEGKPAFFPGTAPSLQNILTPLVGECESPEPEISWAFQTAWKTGINSGLSPLDPVTNVIEIDFQKNPWVLPVDVETLAHNADGFLGNIPGNSAGNNTASKGTITLQKIYYQVFDKAMFIASDALLEYPGETIRLPLRPQIVRDDFLMALLNVGTYHVTGADSLYPVPMEQRNKESHLSAALLAGIALYGIPLSGALPWQERQAAKAETNGQTVEAQRFSRGWFVMRH